MACESIRMYTGLELIQTTKGQPIGIFDAVKIDADISALAANSEMGIAKVDLETWVADCIIDLNELTATQCNALELALRWFAIWRYRKFYIKQIKKGCDCEDEEELLQCAEEIICEQLCKVSSCLVEKFKAFLDPNCLMEDFSDVFGGSVVSKCTTTAGSIKKKML